MHVSVISHALNVSVCVLNNDWDLVKGDEILIIQGSEYFEILFPQQP